MRWTSFWYLFCTSLPLELRIIWVLFLTELASILVSQRPQYPPDHFSHVQSTLLYRDSVSFERERPCTLSSLSRFPSSTYTGDQLRSVQPATLDLSVTSRLTHLGIGVRLPRKQGCRGERRKQGKITVIDHTSPRVTTP